MLHCKGSAAAAAQATADNTLRNSQLLTISLPSSCSSSAKTSFLVLLLYFIFFLHQRETFLPVGEEPFPARKMHTEHYCRNRLCSTFEALFENDFRTRHRNVQQQEKKQKKKKTKSSHDFHSCKLKLLLLLLHYFSSSISCESRLLFPAGIVVIIIIIIRTTSSASSSPTRTLPQGAKKFSVPLFV